MAEHCRRYANLQTDKTGDCKVEYGVCLSAATGGVFGEVGFRFFEKDNKQHELILLFFTLLDQIRNQNMNSG